MMSNLLEKVIAKRPEPISLDKIKEWEEKTKNERPFAFFMYQTKEWFLDQIYEIKYGYRAIIYQIKYTYFKRKDILETKLERGRYHDLDIRILHGLMNELVNFVEIDKAWMYITCHSDEVKKDWRMTLTNYRNKEYGIKYLEAEIKDPDSPNSAEAAKEVLAIYKWWTEVYLHRPDPLELSGWNDYFARNGLNQNREDVKPYIDKLSEIELEYYNEEQEMLIRLIKIRQKLWT